MPALFAARALGGSLRLLARGLLPILAAAGPLLGAGLALSLASEWLARDLRAGPLVGSGVLRLAAAGLFVLALAAGARVAAELDAGREPAARETRRVVRSRAGNLLGTVGVVFLVAYGAGLALHVLGGLLADVHPVVPSFVGLCVALVTAAFLVFLCLLVPVGVLERNPVRANVARAIRLSEGRRLGIGVALAVLAAALWLPLGLAGLLQPPLVLLGGPFAFELTVIPFGAGPLGWLGTMLFDGAAVLALGPLMAWTYLRLRDAEDAPARPGAEGAPETGPA